MNSQRSLDRAIELLGGKTGLVIALVWGFAEGTLFFLVPDIIITFAALFVPKRSWGHLLAVLTGSLVAGLVMYIYGANSPQRAIETVNAVPFVSDAMIAKVSADYANEGVVAMLKGPSSGIPYKVYAVLAPEHQIGLTTFLGMSVPARLERLVITWFIFGAVGLAFQRFWARSPKVGVTIHLVYWLAIYAIYWSRIG